MGSIIPSNIIWGTSVASDIAAKALATKVAVDCALIVGGKVAFLGIAFAALVTPYPTSRVPGAASNAYKWHQWRQRAINLNLTADHRLQAITFKRDTALVLSLVTLSYLGFYTSSYLDS